MQLEIEEIDACTKRLSIEVPAEEVSRAFERVYQRLQKSIRVPGFRRGKVPRSLIIRNHRDVVEREVLESLIPKSYSAALKETSLEAVGQPKVEVVEMDEGNSLSFKATIEVIPPFDSPPFEGREFEKPIPRVRDEDVERMLERVREQNAQLENADERPVQNEDYVILDIVGTLDGIERDDMKSQDQAFQVGKNTLLPEIEEALPGAVVDESQQVEVHFPENHSNTELAGKVVHFRVTVKEIKEPIYPELDDEFAKSLGEYENLDDVRTAIREDLEKNADQQGEAALRKNVLETLAEEIQVALPKGLVESESNALFQQIQAMVSPEERDSLDRKKLSADLDPQARKNVRQRILLERVAGEADFHVTPSQVEAEIRQMAEQYSRPYPEFRAFLEKKDGLTGIEEKIRREKALDHIIEKAHIVSIEDEQSVLAGHTHDHDADEDESPLPAVSAAEE